MPSPTSPPARMRVVKRRLADGTTKEYSYSRDAKPAANRIAPGSVDALIAAYKRAPEWTAKADSTRVTYALYLRDLEAVGPWRRSKSRDACC